MNLQELINVLGLSSSEFADKIGVSRAIISHIQSGRNKPSLSVVQKISTEFPQISLSWLINEEGPILKSSNKDVVKINIPEKETVPYSAGSNNTPTKKSTVSRQLIKIVHYYDDQSFEEYFPKN